MRSAEKRKMNVLVMMCLRSFWKCHEWIRVGNEEVRIRAGIEMELALRVDKRVLKWFGLVEKMGECLMARRAWCTE